MPLTVAVDTTKSTNATIVARVGKYGERTKNAVRAWLGTLGSAGDHNFGQAVCAIKSHALLMGFAETDISIENTRQLSSLLKAADDAARHPSGCERVRKTGNIWTITPPAGTSALGKQAGSQVVASNLQLLDKRTVESRKETAVQANAAIELLESKNAALVANLKDAARREAMLLAQLAEARGASSLFLSSSSSSLPAASLEASHTHAAPTSIHNTRSQAMSVTHKYATREVYVLSGSSARKLPMVMSVAGWSVISELRLQGLLHEVPGQEVTLDDVLRVNSSSGHLGVILEECQVIDDYLLSVVLESSVDEVFKSRAATVSAGKKSAIVKGAAHRGDSTRMTEVTAATQAAGGLKCDPPRRALGLYNLNETRPASVKGAHSECEKRALADKGMLRTAPAGNPKLSTKALVALLRPLANAADFIEILGVAAKRSRDWREVGENEAGPVNKEARLAPETPAAQPGQPPVVTPDDCGAHGDLAAAPIAGLSALQTRTLMDE